MRLVLCSVLALGLVGCGDPPPSEAPPPDVVEDPAFDVTGIRGWYLIGDDLTPADDTLSLRVEGPADFVDAWIDGAHGIRLEPRDGGFELEADIAALEAGEHEILLAADGSRTAFARFVAQRSHPMYFQLTTDWDFADPSDLPLDFQDVLYDEHPGIRITNFIGPYTFTDPTVTDDREDELVAWMKRERDDHGGEISLHIHPYCNFVEYAGLVCNTDESTVRDVDLTGYSVRVDVYGDADFRTLLETADELFLDRDLGKPTTFRAGGWTATIETLRALEATGYVADTSANNWERMDEWNGPLAPGTLYDWNMEHWASITDTSQPYYPSDNDILSDEDPALSILEVPDNAIMVDYVSVEEMIDIFEQNWDGAALDHPVSYMMGWHPSASFSADEMSRIRGILTHADQFLASDGNGPVVYGHLRDMPKVWKQP